MNQRTNSAPKPLSRFLLPSVLVKSTSLVSILSLLSGNFALAQTATPDVVVASTNNTQSDASTKLNQLRQKLYPTTSVRQVQPRTTVSTAPSAAKVQPVRQKLYSNPAPVRQKQPQAAVSTVPSPQLSVPKVRTVTQPATKFPSLQAQPNQLVKKSNTNPAKDYSGAYIDPTAYNVGATKAYAAPNSVVLRERTTGCKAVLRRGQGLSNGICGIPQRRIRVASKQFRPQAVSQLRKNRGVAVAAISPVRVGPISISANGFSATDNRKYNGKIHPIGKLGKVSTGALFPLSIPAQITSLFGWRIHPITGDRRLHTGTDLGAPLGTPVLAAEAGNVALANYWGGYGLTVVLDHSKFTRQTLYAHLSEAFVQPGEWVEQGTVIGRVGSTGNSTGPHLHFETRQLTQEGWVATDPGMQLESALAQLVKTLRIAKAP